MDHNRDSIDRLLEILDQPQAYSEQEIRDIIGHDKTTRETYRLMVEAKRSSRRMADKPIDVDTAWRRFESERLKVKSEDLSVKNMMSGRDTSRPYTWFQSLYKVAAVMTGVLLISGITFAAIHTVRQGQKPETTQTADSTAVAGTPTIAHRTPLPTDTLRTEPKTFDNVALGDILPEIARHYGLTVTFRTEATKTLRLFFTWNPQEPIEKIISELNQFERLSVKRDGENIIVE